MRNYSCGVARQERAFWPSDSDLQIALHGLTGGIRPFLDGIFKGKTFEKKKGQRKEPLAQQIYSRQMLGATYSYCNEPAPDQPNKTYREIGATSSFRSKVKNNAVWQVHQRA